jgi:hypothetical protein
LQHTPKPKTHIMKNYAVVSFFLLTIVASGVAAQALPAVSENPSTHPLNLSTRKPPVPATDPSVLLPGNGTVTEGQTAPGSVGNDEPDRPTGMRYGSGYESRQQGASAGEGGAGSGGSGAKSGSGGDGGKGGEGGKGGKGGGKGD